MKTYNCEPVRECLKPFFKLANKPYRKINAKEIVAIFYYLPAKLLEAELQILQ